MNTFEWHLNCFLDFIDEATVLVPATNTARVPPRTPTKDRLIGLGLHGISFVLAACL